MNTSKRIESLEIRVIFPLLQNHQQHHPQKLVVISYQRKTLHLNLKRFLISVQVCHSNFACMKSSTPTSDIILVIEPVFQMCWLLAAWLSLCAGVSRKTVNTVLKCLHLIITTILILIYTSLQGLGYGVSTVIPKIDIPKDIRTVYARAQLEPELVRIFCCPTCFTQYPADSTTRKCTWKKSPRSKPCGTDMWTTRHTRTGLKQIPKCLYTTQDLGSWLKFFLSRPQIDECLSQAFSKLQQPNPVHQDRMSDIQDSPAWQSLKGFLTSKYHLVFAVYIDWFNPYTNKIAGKQPMILCCDLSSVADK